MTTSRVLHVCLILCFINCVNKCLVSLSFAIVCTVIVIMINPRRMCKRGLYGSWVCVSACPDKNKLVHLLTLDDYGAYHLYMRFKTWISLKTHESKFVTMNTLHSDPRSSLWRSREPEDRSHIER